MPPTVFRWFNIERFTAGCPQRLHFQYFHQTVANTHFHGGSVATFISGISPINVDKFWDIYGLKSPINIPPSSARNIPGKSMGSPWDIQGTMTSSAPEHAAWFELRRGAPVG